MVSKNLNIISFNVNSIRIRLHQLQVLVDQYQPSIIGLQETKVTDDAFPLQDIQALGYEAVFLGQKTHYGVALLTNLPIIQSAKGLNIGPSELQTRLVYAQLEWQGQPIHVYNGYFPQGSNRTHPSKFADKTNFYADLTQHITSHHQPEEKIVVLGDLNIAPKDIDVGVDNPDKWLKRGDCSFLPEEREWIERLYDWGLHDSYRHLKPEGKDYSWFDFRTRAFERSHKPGLRIDHILLTQPLLDLATDSGVDYAIRGMEKPSDHAPVWTTVQSSTHPTMTIASLNAMDEETFVQTLGNIFENAPWVAKQAYAYTPFKGVDALYQQMIEIVNQADHDQKHALLCGHPELAGKLAQQGELTEASTQEQASVQLNQLSPEEMAQISQWNKTYRERFAFPFIVAVRNHSKASLFASFESRLNNDLSDERIEALHQVGQIAKIRLEQLFNETD